MWVWMYVYACVWVLLVISSCMFDRGENGGCLVWYIYAALWASMSVAVSIRGYGQGLVSVTTPPPPRRQLCCGHWVPLFTKGTYGTCLSECLFMIVCVTDEEIKPLRYTCNLRVVLHISIWQARFRDLHV